MSKTMDRDELANRMRISREYLDALEKTGRLKPDIIAAESEVPMGGQEKEARRARQSGNPHSVRIKTKTRTPQETFEAWYATPVGEKFIKDNRTYMEAMNESKGFPTDFRGDHKSQSDIQKHMKLEDKQHRQAEEMEKEQRRRNK